MGLLWHMPSSCRGICHRVGFVLSDNISAGPSPACLQVQCRQARTADEMPPSFRTRPLGSPAPQRKKSRFSGASPCLIRELYVCGRSWPGIVVRQCAEPRRCSTNSPSAAGNALMVEPFCSVLAS